MNNNFLYFSNLNDIHPQLNVIGAPEYENYKNGIIENFEKKSLKSNTKYTTTWYERYVGVIDNNEIEYSLNSSGQRCDEFKKTHEGKHILFAGCSITFGEGLPILLNTSLNIKGQPLLNDENDIVNWEKEYDSKIIR